MPFAIAPYSVSVIRLQPHAYLLAGENHVICMSPLKGGDSQYNYVCGLGCSFTGQCMDTQNQYAYPSWSRLREWTSSISSEELASIAARRSYTATLAKKKQQVEQKR